MRKTIPEIIQRKKGEKIVVLTAYTFPVAKIIDEFADIILVGDSLGMVLYGMNSTLAVTVEMMSLHGAAVTKASSNALVVVDMPFGSYQESAAQAFRNAAKIMAETGAGAVKLEGGTEIAETVKLLTSAGIPVMGHIGMQPQSFNSYGGFKVQGKDKASQTKIMADGLALEKAGAFAVVIEGVKKETADVITKKLKIPTIGIGASANCDGQVLVTEDMVGLTEKAPKFVKKYADIATTIKKAAKGFASDVRTKNFPTAENLY